jgi:hypothetical protein
MNLPFIGIIHNSVQTERYETLIRELQGQGIDKYEIFPSVYDWRSVKRGINLAHKSVVEYGKLRGEVETCVMEDDIRFCGGGAFEYFLKNKPDDFDLYLGGIYVGEIQPDNTVKEFCGFHCYIIHERFYDTFLELPLDEHIDNVCKGKGKFVVCNPFIAVQYNGFSAQTGKSENYDSLLEGRRFYGNFRI